MFKQGIADGKSEKAVFFRLLNENFPGCEPGLEFFRNIWIIA
jgi:hypothetical protein